MDTASVHTVVIGAGVVGLAVARALAATGRELIVLEAEGAFGSATSARNSEVIHAGLYYEPGSLKARLCVAGKLALYDYADARGIAHRRCGKLIVATSAAQEDGLRAIATRAAACGVHDLQWLSAEEARAREPALRCTAALWSPSTGIVDSHGLMLALLGDVEAHGGWLALKSPMLQARKLDGGFELEVGGDAPMRLHTRELVNAAGLHAQALARRIEGLPPSMVPPVHWARGHYFALAGRAPFTHLVYPLPEPGGLGIHATPDLGGQIRFGPDVQWIDPADRGAEDYRVDPARAAAFEGSIRAYWPDLPAGALRPDYAGIRPKLVGPGSPAADFMLQGPAVHGVPGLMNLYGIESPGLTASLAMADEVLQRLSDEGAGA